MDNNDKEYITKLQEYGDKIDDIIQKQNNDLKKIIRKLAGIANDYLSENLVLRQKVDDIEKQYQSKVLNLQETIKQYSSIDSRLATHSINLNNIVQTAIPSIKEYTQQQLSSVARAVGEYNQEIGGISDKIDNLEKHYDSKINPFINSIDSLQSAYELMLTKKDEYEKNNMELLSRETTIVKREEKVSERENNLTSRENEILDQFQYNKDAINNYQNELALNSQLRCKIDELEKEINRLKNDYNFLKGQNGSLIQQINELKGGKNTLSTAPSLPPQE